MDELVPVILGAAFGAAIWWGTGGRPRIWQRFWPRFWLGAAAVALAGAAATVASGEYLQSWVYVLLDAGEAALGLVAGTLAATRLPAPRRPARRRRRAP